jgi:hypothetical protein
MQKSRGAFLSAGIMSSGAHAINHLHADARPGFAPNVLAHPFCDSPPAAQSAVDSSPGRG